jgi:hypothetical protein
MHSLGSQYLQESGSLQRKPPIDERCSAFDEENLKAEQELAWSTRGFLASKNIDWIFCAPVSYGLFPRHNKAAPGPFV